MARRTRPVTQHDFRHALLDDFERMGLLKEDKLNEAHLRLGLCFTKEDFEAAVEYAATLGLSRAAVDRAWYGN